MKKIMLLLLVTLIITLLFGGCQEQQSTTISIDSVTLESDIVEFAFINLTTEKNKSGLVERLTVQWLFHNIADRVIDANIIVEFYDANDNVIHSDSSKAIMLMPPDYTEQFLSPSNMVSYDGEDASLVDHIIIHVIEMED
jgi:hypothetical protein